MDPMTEKPCPECAKCPSRVSSGLGDVCIADKTYCWAWLRAQEPPPAQTAFLNVLDILTDPSVSLEDSDRELRALGLDPATIRDLFEARMEPYMRARAYRKQKEKADSLRKFKCTCGARLAQCRQGVASKRLYIYCPVCTRELYADAIPDDASLIAIKGKLFADWKAGKGTQPGEIRCVPWQP